MAPLLLLSLGLSLVSAQTLNLRSVVRRNYNMAKVSGTWLSVSMASNDMNRIGENGDLRVFSKNIKALPDGSLQFSVHFMLLGDCVEVTMVCEKTERNGEYTLDYKGKNKVLISETDYNMYITFHLHHVSNGTETRVLALYGTCQKYGIGPQNIIYLGDKAFCPDLGRACWAVAGRRGKRPTQLGLLVLELALGEQSTSARKGAREVAADGA
ncbi:epididymal-specific lipocalin-9 [Molossus molossus]|uniref:epididymal-specific lipocalin-9 n=1 Tax=Molossus molossus TaxID=27622 RepID=UPI00174729A8|nr:epididymal-specific lipocalin-9 [Molossus molossus]